MYWDPWIARIMLVDLNSTNGTWLNGQRLTPMEPTPVWSGVTISFTHEIRSRECAGMGHEPWKIQYTMLPEEMLKKDWLEEAYALKDNFEELVPTTEMRSQMALADIKVQRCVL